MPFVVTPIDGGLDLVTAPQSVQPGRLTDCQNYEIARQRGIRRMDGYEPYDGGVSPSVSGLGFLLVAYTGGPMHANKTITFAQASGTLTAVGRCLSTSGGSTGTSVVYLTKPFYG